MRHLLRIGLLSLVVLPRANAENITHNPEVLKALANYHAALELTKPNELPREIPELRNAIVGNRYAWGKNFERSPITLTFSHDEVFYDSPARKYHRPYQTIGSREIRYAEPEIRILFSPDYQRLIVIDSNFAVRTGICVNPRKIPTAKAGLAAGRSRKYSRR